MLSILTSMSERTSNKISSLLEIESSINNMHYAITSVHDAIMSAIDTCNKTIDAHVNTLSCEDYSEFVRMGDALYRMKEIYDEFSAPCEPLEELDDDIDNNLFGDLENFEEEHNVSYFNSIYHFLDYRVGQEYSNPQYYRNNSSLDDVFKIKDKKYGNTLWHYLYGSANVDYPTYHALRRFARMINDKSEYTFVPRHERNTDEQEVTLSSQYLMFCTHFLALKGLISLEDELWYFDYISTRLPAED